MTTTKVVSVALGCLLLGVLTPSALASQGDRYRGAGSDDGTRANVSGTATNNSGGLVFASVAEQNAPPTGGATRMLQIGHFKATSGFSSDCGAGSIGLAVEREIAGAYTCDMFFASFGSNHRLASLHGANGWSAYEDGTVIDGPFSLGYAGGYSVARAEAYWTSTGPTYNFTWGPSGFTAWQYSTCGGCSYTTVSGAPSTQDGGWTIGATPSPFTISR